MNLIQNTGAALGKVKSTYKKSAEITKQNQWIKKTFLQGQNSNYHIEKGEQDKNEIITFTSKVADEPESENPFQYIDSNGMEMEFEEDNPYA
jgi:hypothetical protein